MNEPCEICQSTKWDLICTGKIHNGAFKNYVDGEVFRCSSCYVDRLSENDCLKSEAYQTEEYRGLLEQGLMIEDFFKHADPVQIHNLSAFLPFDLRNKIIADVGSGGIR